MTLRHWSRVTPYTSPCGLAECCVFVKQSPGPLHCGSQAPGGASPPDPRERPLFRSYGAGLPSSLTWFLPRALVCSTCPPVSVCGTGQDGIQRLDAFLGGMVRTPSPRANPGDPVTARPARTAFHSPAACPLGPAVPIAGASSLPRHAIALRLGFGNVDPTSVGYAFRPGLRTRLTLGGRTWPRKPRTFGGADSHRPFRYSCLHDRFHAVHRDLHPGFAPHGTLSYQAQMRFRSFGCPLESRSFSARHHSSSELLRILQMMAASEPTSWMSMRRHILTIH